MSSGNTAPVAQDDTPVRNQFTVNETTAGDQDPVRIVELVGGRILVIWDPATGTRLPDNYTAQILNADGTEAVGEFSLWSAPEESTRLGDVTALSSGGFVVTWGQFTNQLLGAEGEGKARIFDGSGAPLSGTILLQPDSSVSMNTPQVVELADGRMLFGWTQQQGSGPAVSQAKIYTSAGLPTEDTFTIPLNGLNPILADLNVAPDDRLFVTWFHEAHPEFNLASRMGYDGQFFDLDGTPNGDRITIRENSAGLDDRIVMLQNGGFVSVHPEYDGAGDGIAARFFAADGTLLKDGLINQVTQHFQYGPQADVLANGQVVIVWGGVYDTDDVDRSAIKARLFNPDGTAATDEFVVNEVNYESQWFPHVAALHNGQFVVTWGTQAGYGFGDGSGSAVTARIFNADGSSAAGPPVAETFVLTHERMPYLLRPDQMLQNDMDADGDLLSIMAVSGVSALGATVLLRPDGSVFYDPGTSLLLSDLDTGETRLDSFGYTVSDGALSDSATVYISVAGKTDGTPEDLARDDLYTISPDELDAAGSTRLRLGDKAEDTHLLANDIRPRDSIETVNGGISPFNKWFDGNNGGQFKVFPSGTVDFRNVGDLVAPGETTGFSYVAFGDAATVSLSITAPNEPLDDSFEIAAEALAAAGPNWFRLGAKNDNTDVLANNPGVDEIIFVQGDPIEEGVWFDGDQGGQFRVFKGGVLDFRNQGEKVGPGDVTGFEYGAVQDGSLQSFGVSVAIDDFDFL